MTIVELKDLRCLACTGETPKLTNIEIQDNIKFLNKWQINDDNEMIFKKFIFKSFKKALNFTIQISKIAEIENHHPDISFGYGYCIIMIHTHAIKALTINDFILASKIDNIENS